jgi:hypothetical protein
LSIGDAGQAQSLAGLGLGPAIGASMAASSADRADKASATWPKAVRTVMLIAGRGGLGRFPRLLTASLQGAAVEERRGQAGPDVPGAGVVEKISPAFSEPWVSDAFSLMFG